MISRRVLFALLTGASSAALFNYAYGAPLAAISCEAVFDPSGNNDTDVQHWVDIVDTLASKLLTSAPHTSNAVYSPWSVTTVSALLRLAIAGKIALEMDTALGLSDFPGWKTGIAALISRLDVWDRTPLIVPGWYKEIDKGIDEITSFVSRISRFFSKDKSIQIKGPNESLQDPIFHQAAGVFVARGIRVQDDFLRQARSTLNSTNYRVNFQDPMANYAIHTWLKRQTGGLITSEQNYNAKTVAVMLSTAYFAAKWASRFTPAGTMKFTIESGAVVDADCMKQDTIMKVIVTDRYQGIRIDYSNPNVVMDIILPAKGVSVSTVIDSHIRSQVSAALASTPARAIHLFMPKWKVNKHLDLKEWYSNLGIPSIFSLGADFSPLTSTPISIDQARHDAAIYVTREGTVAAAVSEVAVGLSAPTPTMTEEIWVDRPFAYHIIDTKLSLPLFSGIVANPAA